MSRFWPATFLAAALFGAVVAPREAAALTAATAADICASNANPCNVTAPFDIAKQTCSNNLAQQCATNTDCTPPGVCKVVDAVLDFGTRTVSVTGTGAFNFGTGSGSILCGNFTASTTNPVIDANGPNGVGGSDSGSISVRARRQCTDNSPSVVPCVDLSDCKLGACGTRRCEFKSTKTCLSDANCDLGTCGLNKRCSASATIVRCTTNADCQYGSCLAQLTCANRASDPVACSSNADCDFGDCTVGSASITMGGAILGNSDSPALIDLSAADNVTISKSINLNSTNIGADGGELTVNAAAGSINISDTISATGGSDSTGGSIDLSAGLDITTSAAIDASGGDFDGGSVDISAGRDLTIGRDLSLSSIAGGGFGGDLCLEAGRDLSLNGVSAANKTLVQNSGHTDATNFAGDGGSQDLSAGRNLALNVNTRMIGNGSAPDGSGSDVTIDAVGNILLGGDLVATALGATGAGGTMTITSGGTSQVSASGNLNATGGDGGLVEIDSTGNATFGGIADAAGSTAGGFGGDLFLSVEADTTISGTLTVNGANSGSVEVDACRVALTGTGVLNNSVITGTNKVVVNESMKALAGSKITAGANGSNTLVYRTAAKPPVLGGTVTPAPILQVDGNLAGCPVCGNLEVDKGETCDDGNTTSGDGCSSDCQNEKCLAQTIPPGFPTVAICEDGNLCTADVCNTALAGGTCQHPAKVCDDGFACTTDTCIAESGACNFAPNDSLCNDNNDCTDDICTKESGCTSTANTAPCDDGNSCTDGDICSANACHGTDIPGCGVCGDGQINSPEQCDDGNATCTSGEYCGVDCVLVACGKPTCTSGTPKSSDALFILKAAVSQVTCSLRVCDVDNSGKVLASDALRTLRKAVGQVVTLNCPTA